jgi:hypothetical protein
MAFELERLFGHNAQPGNIAWVIDFKGFGFKHIKLAISLITIPLCSEHYPERMGQVVLMDPSAVFDQLWRKLQMFIDPVTRSKVVFLRGDQSFEEYGNIQWRCADRIGKGLGVFSWLQKVKMLPGNPGSFPLGAWDLDPVAVEDLERARDSRLG